MKIGFFVWNPFQIYQFDSIVRNCPGATYVLLRRKNIDFEKLFPAEFVEQIGAPIRFVTRNELAGMDGEFDVMVCQTPFGYMERFEKTKIVGVQYSMSKERHQHGAWRLLCDLNLVYGQYSYDRVSHYSPCVMVGNPRFDRWFENKLEQSKIDSVRARLNSSKKTILYLPTWGALSSIAEFGDAVAALGEDYNIIAKVHHNTDSLEASKKMTLNASGVQDIFGASDDLLVLLSVADLVLSDYSGAIFDAINVGKPVVLLQHSPEALAVMEAKKFGLESIEYAQRSMIGPAIASPNELIGVVQDIFSGGVDFSEKNKILKAQCFAREQGCGVIAAQAIAELIAGETVRPYYQIYARDMLREYRVADEQAKIVLRRSKTAGGRIKKIVADAAVESRTKKKKIALFFTHIKKRLLRSYSFSVRAALKFPRYSIVRHIHSEIERAGGEKTIYAPSALTVRLAKLLLSSRILLSIAARYDSAKTQDINLIFSRLAFEKSKSVGLTPYINALAKYDRQDELLELVRYMLAASISMKLRYLFRLTRVNDFLGTQESEIRVTRQEVHAYIVGALKRSRNKVRNARMLNVLVTNRWLKDAMALAEFKATNPHVRKRIHDAVERVKRLMGDYYSLVEAANFNYLPELNRDDYLCLYQGRIVRVGEVRPSKIVEFNLPPYFFSESETDKDARERICSMLRATIRSVEMYGAAVVPMHQFRLDSVNPNPNWPVSFSYHTTGDRSGWWHIKDASFPGFFSIDKRGYSGWSSIESMRELPEDIKEVMSDDVEEVWNELRERFVLANHSKYKQQDEPFQSPNRRYIFLPLQVVGDTVAKLAWIPTLDLAKMLVRLLPAYGYDLVIKPHPKCANEEVKVFISKLHSMPNVHVSNSSIHEIVAGASAVITVNSGVGLEALLHGKLVITTGRSEYGCVTAVADNEEGLVRRINEIPGGPNLEKIKRFLFFYVKKHLIALDDQEALDHRVHLLLDSD